MEVMVGCSGYSYRGWRGKFYPPDLPRYRFIEFYEEHFPIVELNFTFYRMDNARKTLQNILRRTSRLRLSIKLNRVFTHAGNYSTADVDNFIRVVDPVLQSGRFIGILAQFPPSFERKEESIRHILRLLKDFHDIRMALEFRSSSWMDEETLRALADRGNIAIVNVDGPPVEGLFLGPWKTFGPFNYVRLHGRNTKGWKDYRTRYLYDYSDEELMEIARRIRVLRSLETFVFFNNTPEGNAPINALRLMELLER